MYRVPEAFFLLMFSSVAMDYPDVSPGYDPVRRSIKDEYDSQGNLFVTDISRYKSWRLCETSLHADEQSARKGWINYRYGKICLGYTAQNMPLEVVRIDETYAPVIAREGFIEAYWVKEASRREKYTAQIALLSFCLDQLFKKQLTKISCNVLGSDRILRRWLVEQGFECDGKDASVEILQPVKAERHSSVIQTSDAALLCFTKKISQ